MARKAKPVDKAAPRATSARAKIRRAPSLGDMLIEAATETNFRAQVLATSVLCVALAVGLDLLLVGVQRVLTPWTRRAAA